MTPVERLAFGPLMVRLHPAPSLDCQTAVRVASPSRMSSSPSSAASVFDDPEVKALFDAAAYHSLKSKACERGLKIHAFSVDTGLCAFCGKHENDLKNQQKQGQNR